MNILINSYCNLKCPYCFADHTMQNQNTLNMSKKNFEIAIEWCKKMEQTQLRIIGGEPTLSPDFISFLEMGARDPWFDSILIFSNMTFDRDIAEAIARIDRKTPIMMLPNINEFDLLIPKYKKNILFNLNFLSQNLQSFHEIGINIYRPDMDLTQWEQIFITHPDINILRYSIAIPRPSVLNESFDFYNYYHQFQDILLKLNDLSVKYNIELSCDCNNLPVCCYDDDVIVKLLKGSGFALFSNPQSSLVSTNNSMHCGFPVIDLHPDLTVAPCFGCNVQFEPYITDFKNPEDLYQWAMDAVNVSNKVARKECLSCQRYQRTGISCSCRACHLIEVDNND